MFDGIGVVLAPPEPAMPEEDGALPAEPISPAGGVADVAGADAAGAVSVGAMLPELLLESPGVAVVGAGPTAVFESLGVLVSGVPAGAALPAAGWEASPELELCAKLPVAITSAAADARKRIFFMAVS